MAEEKRAESFASPAPTRHLLRRVSEATPAGSQSPAVRIPATPFLKKLGFGTGVSVFLYERSPTQAGVSRSPWAVKKINQNHREGGRPSVYTERLEREAKILKTLAHPNIIGFRGFKPTESGSSCLVMEDGQKSLLDWIEERRDEVDQPFSSHLIEKVVRCVCQALDYLHTEKQLMHGDLKAANILIVDNFERVKLCDFGVTLPVNSEGKVSDPNSQYVGTEAWSPLEVLLEKEVTTKADIFAFGLVIYEMLALQPPHVDKLCLDDTDTDTDTSVNICEDTDTSVNRCEESFDDSEFRAALGTRPPLPDHMELNSTYRKVLEIFFATTCEDPNQRPSAKEILQMLDTDDDGGDDSVLCVNMVKKNLNDDIEGQIQKTPPAL